MKCFTLKSGRTSYTLGKNKDNKKHRGFNTNRKLLNYFICNLHSFCSVQ